MISLFILFFCSCIISFVLGQEHTETVQFSGFFSPDTSLSTSDFAAAFLVSRERFLATEKEFRESRGIAGITFSAIRKGCSNCGTFATRDFLDFFVEHLSPYSNHIPFERTDIAEQVSRKAEYRANLFRTHALMNPNPNVFKDSVYNNTIGILPFSSKAFSKDDNLPFQNKIRQHYFELTFWSVYQYFSHITVITSDEDLPALQQLKLPIYHTIVIPNPVLSVDNKTDSLPRQGIEKILDHLLATDDKLYQQFQFVFYTEGDQIVHIREIQRVFDFIFNSKLDFIAVPHRLQTFLLSNEFSPEYQKYYQTVYHKHLDLPSSTVIIQDSKFDPVGSCCEDGLFEIEDCKIGWWYQCNEWGIKDMFPWFRFGESGFPIPPVTEHRRSCQYYPTRTTCDLPSSCEERTPQKKSSDVIHSSQLCKPYDTIKYLGPSKQTNSTSQTQRSKYYDQELSELERTEKELRTAIVEVSRLRKRVKRSRKALKGLLNHSSKD